jgi:hypothetical protein
MSKHLIRWPIFALALVAATAATAQGAFQNLNFEMADVSNPDSLSRVPFSNAFPYWQASGVYDVPPGPPSTLAHAYYNATDLDQMTIGIYDSAGPAGHPVFGNYTAYIEADLGSIRQGYITLTQTGVIPSGAKSLRFDSTSYSSLAGVSAQLSFNLNGTPVPSIPLDIEPTYVLWGADISVYAGSSAQIGFTVQAQYPFPGTSDPHVFVGVGLDNISFSAVAVPEPRGLGLAACALLLAALRKGAHASSGV